MTQNTPRSSQHKIAFTGTNCSGKTTMALAVTAKLKTSHILAEVVSSQDRKITWKDEHFPVDYRAHYGMITNLIHAEVQAELKGDAQVVITDRSVLDLFAIATYDHPSCEKIWGMEAMILSWLKSYTKIYYLEPLPYQADNKRPSDDFRMATHNQLMQLLAKYELPNLVRMPRSEVYADIKALLGVKPNTVFAETEKWQILANLLQKPLLVKEPEFEGLSDYDVWLISDTPYDYAEDAQKLAASFEQFWGSAARLDIMLAPAPKTVTFAHALYTPLSK